MQCTHSATIWLCEGVTACWARAGHLFLPLLGGVSCAVRQVGYFGACGRIRTPYFVILGASWLFKYGYFDASFAPGIWYMVYSPCVFCRISRNFAFGGRSVTLLMDCGSMSLLMFGLMKATQPARRMRERMR